MQKTDQTARADGRHRGAKQMLCRMRAAALSPRAVRIYIAAAALLLAFVLLALTFVMSVSAALCKSVRHHIRTKEELSGIDEPYDVILVLGCRVYSDGRLSHMLEDRVSVASSLYLDGVGEILLMSGDNQSPYYNEVDPMKAHAVSLGVSEEAIYTDPLGLSTYESIERAMDACRGKRILIVTQEYHLYRALYIADRMGLDADGVSADLRPYFNQWKYDLREILARCKDVLLCAADEH